MVFSSRAASCCCCAENPLNPPVQISRTSSKNDLYGALTDREVTDMLTDKTRPGGYILFYTKSFAFDTAAKVIAEWEKEAKVEKIGMYETLLVYRKTA
jgi:hypothetical protein